MKSFLEKITTTSLVLILASSTFGCGLHYERLSNDIATWDVNTIFSQQVLAKEIKTNKLIAIDNLTFYKNYFDKPSKQKDIKSLKEFYKKNTENQVYFLPTNNENEFSYNIYLNALPMINHGIIDYELKTKNGDRGLIDVNKIADNINYTLETKDEQKSGFVIKQSSIEKIKNNGIIEKADLEESKKINDVKNGMLLAQLTDTSKDIPGFTASISLAIKLKISGNENKKYFNEKENILIGTTITCW